MRSRPTARARWAHLLAEKNFSDVHAAGKMIGFDLHLRMQIPVKRLGRVKQMMLVKS